MKPPAPAPTPTPRRWVSVDYVQQATGFARWTVYRMAREGKIPAIRIGRSIKFDAVEIDKWMARQPKASA